MSSKPLLFQTLKIKSNHKHMQVAPCVIHNQSINEWMHGRPPVAGVSLSRPWWALVPVNWICQRVASVHGRCDAARLLVTSAPSEHCADDSPPPPSLIYVITHTHTDTWTHIHTYIYRWTHTHTHTDTHTSMLTAVNLPLIKRWLAVSAGWSTSIMFTVTYLCHLPVLARTCHSSLQRKTGLQVVWIWMLWIIPCNKQMVYHHKI